MIALDATIAPTPTGIPERQMWCAVLDKVLEDLRGRLPDPPRPLSPRLARFQRQRSRWSLEMAKWHTKHVDIISARYFAFSKGNNWRASVCDLAGITEECFVKSARARMPV